MKFSKRRRHEDALSWVDGGFLPAGHYEVSAVEDVAGWTSPFKVTLNKDPEEIRRLVDVAFASIEATSKTVQAEAVAHVRAQQYREMGSFLRETQQGL